MAGEEKVPTERRQILWDEDKIYATVGPIAKKLKIILQMVIGLGLTLVLIFKCFLFLGIGTFVKVPACLEVNALQLVGEALMLSAGFELAYMLFTSGPDEAVEPVILGIAATILIVVSKDGVGSETYWAVLALCLAMALLFFVREKFINSDSDE